MDEIQQQLVTHFMVLQKKAPKAIYEGLVATLGNKALVHTTVKRWAALQGWLRDR